MHRLAEVHIFSTFIHNVIVSHLVIRFGASVNVVKLDMAVVHVSTQRRD